MAAALACSGSLRARQTALGPRQGPGHTAERAHTARPAPFSGLRARSILCRRPPAPRPPHTEGRPGGMRGGRAKPSRSGGRPGAIWLPGVPGPGGGGSRDSRPRTHRLRSPTSLHGPPTPSHEAPDSRELRASGAVWTSPFPIATATKWRTRDERPATTPLRSARSVCARAAAPAPCGRRGPTRDVTGHSQSGARSGRSGRAPLAPAPAFREEAEEAGGGGHSLPGPRSAAAGGAAAAGPARRWQENSWS